MWPAVDGDRGDVARGIETTGAQHAVEVVDDLLLEIVEGHLQQIRAAEAKLLDIAQPLVGGALTLPSAPSAGPASDRG